MKSKNLFTIKFVSDHTGLTPHVIRAWERRYAAVVPKRTQSNRRLYCQEDIQRLNLLKMAIDAGHQISRIADAGKEELRQILGLSLAIADKSGKTPLSEQVTQADGENYLKACIQSVSDLNPVQLEKTLSDAAVQLPRRKMVEAVIEPLFKHIGDLWSSGRLKVLNEHLASNCVRNIMWDMLRSVSPSPSAPCIVIGSPAGQHHELGALAAALASTEAGWRPIYVGVNLPAEELALAVERFHAKCIGLSISHTMNDNQLRSELLNLRRHLGPDRIIIIGGLKASCRDDLLQRVKARFVRSWPDYISTLNSLNAF